MRIVKSRYFVWFFEEVSLSEDEFKKAIGATVRNFYNRETRGARPVGLRALTCLSGNLYLRAQAQRLRRFGHGVYRGAGQVQGEQFLIPEHFV
jgi:hypothetical protein